MTKLFGTSGFRDLAPERINPELAYHIGASFATYHQNQGTIVIGYDTRETSVMLREALASGIMSSGCDAIDIGQVPTPLLSYCARELDCVMGVMITASHNPPEYNGIKGYDEKGMEWTPDREQIVEALILERSYKLVDWDKVGSCFERSDVAHSYIQAALKYLGKADGGGLRVAVDTANGSGYKLTPYLLRRLGCQVISVNAQPDGHFPAHSPEPTMEILQSVGGMVADVAAMVVQDGDADRVAFIDDKGKPVHSDRVFAYFAKSALEKNRKGTVVTTVDTSLLLDGIVEEYGGRLVRTRLGKTHALLEKEKPVLAGEPWKIIFPDWGCWIDGVMAAAKITSDLIRVNAVLSEILSDIPERPQERVSFACLPSDKEKVMRYVGRVLPSEFSNVKDVWTYDGVRVNLNDDSWVLVRSSGTEGKVRLYAEAQTPESLKRLVEVGTRIIKEGMEESRKPS